MLRVYIRVCIWISHLYSSTRIDSLISTPFPSVRTLSVRPSMAEQTSAPLSSVDDFLQRTATTAIPAAAAPPPPAAAAAAAAPAPTAYCCCCCCAAAVCRTKGSTTKAQKVPGWSGLQYFFDRGHFFVNLEQLNFSADSLPARKNRKKSTNGRKSQQQ